MFTNEQEIHYNAFCAADEVLTADADIINTIPALAEAHDKHQDNLEQLEIEGGLIDPATSGKSVAKKAARDLLAEAARGVTALLFSEGNATNNIELVNQSRASHSAYIRMRDGRLPLAATAILNLGTTHKTALIRRGLQDGQLEELKTFIENFTKLSPAPKLARVDKGIQTKRLEALFTATRLFLEKEVDPMMENLAKRYPDLAKRWFEARELDKTAGKHASSNEPAAPAGA